MNIYKITGIIAAFIIVSISISAGNKDPFTHKLVVGYNFGATAPVPIPREVRSIDSYWPQFTPYLGYNISYDISNRFYIETGIALDIKGMGVRDKVKYIYTDVWMDGNNIKGYFTGKNETEVKISYTTIPIRIGYRLSDTWALRTGGYFSYRNSSEFSGTVWDGYLRKTNDKDIINSEYLEILKKNDAKFDFGKDMRNFDMGVSIGCDHILNNRFGISCDLTYSLTPIFPNSFTGMDMKMRNIYISMGISYKLK